MSVLIFLRDLVAMPQRRTERGASAVEYGLLVAGIAGLLVASVFMLGDAINFLMGDSCGTITSFVEGNTAC